MAGESQNVTTLLAELEFLLNKGNAHKSLDDALDGIPFEMLSKKPENLPYTIWQLAEHIRITQDDLLNFCENPLYESPKWPEGYWPEGAAPANEGEWKKCVDQIKRDRHDFIEMLKDSEGELYDKFENADGQSLLREALVLADHNSYHTAEIIVLRRLLDDWK